MAYRLVIMFTLLISVRGLEFLNHNNVILHSHKSISGSTELNKEQVAESMTFHCYRYTWPGEGYNSTKAACQGDIHTPCILPYVVTNDTMAPVPVPSIVKKHCDKVGCKVTCLRKKGESCIRYSHYRNNQLINQTFFCGYGKDLTDQNPITFGEFSQTLKGEFAGEIRKVQLCEDSLCNSANYIRILPGVILTVLAALFVHSIYLRN